MYYKQTTQIPNEVIEAIPTLNLTGAQVKLLLIFYRCTWGWQKKRDRITNSQLIQKSGLGQRIVTTSIQALIDKHLLKVTDYYGNELNTPLERRGKLYLYYTPLRLDTALIKHQNSIKKLPAVQKEYNNNTNGTKPNMEQVIQSQGTKRISDRQRIQQILFQQGNDQAQ